MKFNWNLCIICQKDTKEPLRCPLLKPITCGDITDPYRSFLSNVNRFKAINDLPTQLKFGDDEYERVVQSFVNFNTEGER